MKKINKQEKMRQPRAAYAGFLFQTFFRRPAGYIIPCLYIVYLSLILLIVPKIIKTGPLFIWTIGGFNMPVFNLFFIAAMAAALAVCIFRTGREDGTELSLSSKPLTKGSMVGIKVLVYLAIMLAICIITNCISLLTLPIFGEYNEVTNLRGIAVDKYLGLNLSILFGNLINMLLFGGIAVLISMIGGQVATMVGTVGIVFVLCLMNFLYPKIVTSSVQVLQDKYGSEILSYTCNTLQQYRNSDKSGQKKYATIQCVTDNYGEELTHFDTREYWLKAEMESGGLVTNYIDIARQLSSLYSAFGLDDSKLSEASKLSIGVNNNFKYTIDESTHVGDDETIANEEYPIAYYGMTTHQGMRYPQVLVIGGDMSVSKTNWLARSTLNQYPFDAVSVLTNGNSGLLLSSKEIRKEYAVPFRRIYDLAMDDKQNALAISLYNEVLELMTQEAQSSYQTAISKEFFQAIAHEVIVNNTSDIFFPGEYSTWTAEQQHEVVSKIHFAWAIHAQNKQINSINQYCIQSKIDDKFPFKTSSVNAWYTNNAEKKTSPYRIEYVLGVRIFQDPIQCRVPKEGSVDYTEGFDQLVLCRMNYAETYANMYQYEVKSFYNVYTIMTIWSIVAALFFAGSIVIYKKTDFK